MKKKTFAYLALLSFPLMVLGGCSDGKKEAPAADRTPKDVITLIMERRSIRKYTTQPVEHEKLATIAKCGINAPNARNAQRWAVAIVEDTAWVKGTSALFAKMHPDQADPTKGYRTMFRNAPNVILIATPDGQETLDAGLMGQNMILAAQSMGLGTCCLGSPARFLQDTPEAKPYLDRLGFPEGYKLCYVIAIGYPDESPEAKPRDSTKVKFIQ